MPEEVTPDTGNTTPVDWESDANPYVQRYRDVQSTLTPVQQENARLRALETDRDAYIALGQKHGFEFEFEEEKSPEPGLDPELATLRAQVAEQAAWKAEVETERQQRQFDEGRQAVLAQNNAWAKEAGITLADFDHAAIIQRAIESDAATEDDVKPIFDEYVAHKTAEREAILAEAVEARKRPRVPHTPGGGAADTGIPDYSEMSRADIDKAMAERAMGAL